MKKELQQRIVDLEEEIDDLQQQLEAQDKIPDMRDWERLLERLEWEKRMSNCLGEAAVHAQEQEDKLKEEIINLKKQLEEMSTDRNFWRALSLKLKSDLDETIFEFDDTLTDYQHGRKTEKTLVSNKLTQQQKYGKR